MKMYFNATLASLAFLGLCSLSAMENQALQAATVSTDLQASSVFAPGMFQQPEIDSLHALYSQNGIGISPAQWHLLLPDTVKELRKNVSEKTKDKNLLDRIQLIATLVSDMHPEKLAHNEKQKQQSVLSDLLSVCLPQQELGAVDRAGIKLIEATKSLPILTYVFTALKKQNEESPLPISSRGHILQLQKRIEVLEKHGDYSVDEQLRSVVSTQKSSSGASSPMSIFAAANSVLGGSPVSSPTAPSVLEQLPLFDPADSLLIGQEAEGAVNVFALLNKNERELTKQITALDQMIQAIDYVLQADEIKDIPFTQRILQELRDERKAQLTQVYIEQKAIKQNQNITVEKVSEAHKQLSERREERQKALEKVEEQTKLATQQLATLTGFINRATQLKTGYEEKLMQLESRKEAIQKAQERVKPGIEISEPLCKKNA